MLILRRFVARSWHRESLRCGPRSLVSLDLRRDGAGYRMAGLWMTDEELNELTQGFVSLLQPYLANPATPDRRRRILRTIVLSAPVPAGSTTRPPNGPG